MCEAGSATAALEALEDDPPDLLLLDINLPDRTGWEVLRALDRRKLRVPTIVTSAVRPRPGRLDEFQPLAYLPKPFPLESLLRLVLNPPPTPAAMPPAPRPLHPVRPLDAERPLRTAADMLSRAPRGLMTATTVVGVLGQDDIPSFHARVQELCEVCGLEATVELQAGSYSVRFVRL